MSNERTPCIGRCGGTGWVMVPKDEPRSSAYAMLWTDAERARPSGDGFHCVKCIDCDGTGFVKVRDKQKEK